MGAGSPASSGASCSGRPLVWDDGEETAIQHPDGGTKIAWGGPPLGPEAAAAQPAPLVLASDDPVRDFERLGALARLLDAGLAWGHCWPTRTRTEFHLVAAD